MGKETVICIIIIILIILGNIVTQKYTMDSVGEICNQLTDLKEELARQEKEINTENIKGKFQEIENTWNSKHEKLAYYIEHNELEKVENNIAGLKSFIETNEYSEAISELDKGAFILKHIEEKYKFNLENIF